MSTVRAAVAALLVAIPLALAPVASALAVGGPPAPSPARVVADCVHYRVEPHRLVGACADANEYVAVRHWSSWADTRAVGRGQLVVNDCTPDCAAGTMRHQPARVVLDHPVSTRHGRVFTRARVSYVRDGQRDHTDITLPRRPIG